MLEISIPATFPECGTCPLAKNVIVFWENFASLADFPFCKTTIVRVFCFQNTEEKSVTMMERAMQICQYLPDGPLVEVAGGSLSPYEVNCPGLRKKL